MLNPTIYKVELPHIIGKNLVCALGREFFFLNYCFI